MLVYRVCWIKLDTGGKEHGRNNNHYRSEAGSQDA